MTLESYLIIACLAGNSQGCSKAGEAYYIYSGYQPRVEDYVKRIEKKNKEFLFMVTLASSIAEKRIVFPVYRNKIIRYTQLDPGSYLIEFSYSY